MWSIFLVLFVKFFKKLNFKDIYINGFGNNYLVSNIYLVLVFDDNQIGEVFIYYNIFNF